MKKIGKDDPAEVVAARIKANTEAIAAFLKEAEKSFSAKFETLRAEWRAAVQVDQDRYPETAAPYAKGRISHTGLSSVLTLVDQRRSEIESDLRSKYFALSRALDRLKEGIDLEEALSVIDDDRAELEDRLRDIYQVAQLGIAVEIIGAMSSKRSTSRFVAISKSCRRMQSRLDRTSLPMRRTPH